MGISPDSNCMSVPCSFLCFYITFCTTLCAVPLFFFVSRKVQSCELVSIFFLSCISCSSVFQYNFFIFFRKSRRSKNWSWKMDSLLFHCRNCLRIWRFIRKEHYEPAFECPYGGCKRSNLWNCCSCWFGVSLFYNYIRQKNNLSSIFNIMDNDLFRFYKFIY